MKNKYFLKGKITAKTGHKDEHVNILLEASKINATAKGCKFYVIGKDQNETKAVYLS